MRCFTESGKGRQSCGQSGLQGAPPQTALPESQPDYSLCSEGQKRNPDVLTRLRCPIQLIAQTKSCTQRAEKVRGQWDQDTPTVNKNSPVPDGVSDPGTWPLTTQRATNARHYLGEFSNIK